MHVNKFYKSLLIAGLVGTGSGSVISRDVTTGNAEAAFHTLQQWYNTGTGIWSPSTGWWNSANCLTALINLAKVDGNVKQEILSVISNTYTQAQRYNSQSVKVVGEDDDGSGRRLNRFLIETYYADHWPYLPPGLVQKFGGRIKAQMTSGFLNDYYDDEGWWALAWIDAYDLTKDSAYLSQAQSIFADMNIVFGQTDCSTNSGGTGGIWWDKPHTYVNAIANELFLAIAASLANRVPSGSNNPDYLSIAKKQWAWFKGTGMLQGNNNIIDGLDQSSCQPNGGTVWTYNQGVILGGLVELSKATHDGSYIQTAKNIADAAIATLAPGGILTEPCESDNGCGGDGSQFKGVFMRNLVILQNASPQDRYKQFLETNANSIWAKDRNGNNELSLKWAGPFVSPANASTQSSALDGLVAALSV